MKRRHFVASVLGTSLVVPNALAVEDRDQQHQGHGNDSPRGELANATVSFGAWPPFDRLKPPSDPPPNLHRLTPDVVTIRKGGTVNFIVAGLHNVVVYGPRKRVEDVDFTSLIPTPGAPPGFPGIIEDREHRVFRGIFMFGLAQDRVEVVHFPRRGWHLVICGFSPHFNDREKMFGWVRVV
jgi:hypothetical protein